MRSFRARARRLANQELDPIAWVDEDGRAGAGEAACAGAATTRLRHRSTLPR